MATTTPTTTNDFPFTDIVQNADTVSATAASGFDVQTAALMGSLCVLSYNQFAANTTVIASSALSGLGGSLTQLMSASFTSSEPIAAGFSADIGGSGVGDYATVVAGFALTGTMPDGTQSNIIVIRGTRTYNEWLNDLEAIPVPWTQGNNGPSSKGYDRLDLPYGMVHGGFYNLYNAGTDGAQPASTVVPDTFGTTYTYSRAAGSIAAQVAALVTDASWDASLPLYVTGHSMGAALAELAAMDIAVNFPSAFPTGEIYVYSLAGPLLAAGMMLDDFGYAASKFASAFTSSIPNTWRVVNAADIVPISPPASTTMGNAQITFAQTAPSGNVVNFVAQTGSILTNHSCADTYQPYLAALQTGF